MPRGNPQNFRPLSREEAQARGRAGGIKSGENRRARKTLREELIALLSQGDTQKNMTLALIEKALSGDTKAFEVIRDTAGEKPVDKIVVADVDSSIIADVESIVTGKSHTTSTNVIVCTNSSGDTRKYESIEEAANDLELKIANISKCLDGKTKTCGGYTWKYDKQ